MRDYLDPYRPSPGAPTTQPISTDTLTPEEQQALQRQKAHILATHRQLYSDNKETTPQTDTISFWPWPVLGGIATALAALCLLLVSPQFHRSSLAPIVCENLDEQQTSPPSTKKQWTLTVPKSKTIKLSVKKRWSLKATGGTRLKLQRKSAKHTEINLQQGQIRVHVNPKAKQRFVVQCHQAWQVEVKGTRFSVRQSKHWLRVEVEKGRVWLQRKGQNTHILSKRQGLRVALDDQRTLSYRLPPKSRHSLDAKLDWWAQHEPRFLQFFLWDEGKDQRHTYAKRREILMSGADTLTKYKRPQQAFRIWMHLYRKSHQKGQRINALGYAIDLCLRMPNPQGICLTPLRQYQRLVRPGQLQREHFDYQLIRLQHRKANSTIKLQDSIRHYLRQYSQSPYRHKLQRWLKPSQQRSQP